MTAMQTSPMDLPQLLDITIPEPEYFLPPIVPVSATTMVVSHGGVSPLPLAALAAYTIAAGIKIRSLQTFGRNSVGRVAFFAPTRHARQVQAAFVRLSKKGACHGTPAPTTRDLEFSWLNPTESDGLWLDTSDGRDRLEARIAGRQLCVIYDLAACFKTMGNDARFADRVIEWFREQNRRGIAILAFQLEGKRSRLWARVHSDLNLMRLAVGNGPGQREAIRITRQNDGRLPWDSISLNFSYTSSGPLEFDFSPATKVREISRKQQKIQERRMQISLLLAQKVDRKNIANQLGISVATLSRDIEALGPRIEDRPPRHK